MIFSRHFWVYVSKVYYNYNTLSKKSIEEYRLSINERTFKIFVQKSGKADNQIQNLLLFFIISIYL